MVGAEAPVTLAASGSLFLHIDRKRTRPIRLASRTGRLFLSSGSLPGVSVATSTRPVSAPLSATGVGGSTSQRSRTGSCPTITFIRGRPCTIPGLPLLGLRCISTGVSAALLGFAFLLRFRASFAHKGVELPPCCQERILHFLRGQEVYLIRAEMGTISRTWGPVTRVRPNAHARSDQLVQTRPLAISAQVLVPQLNMPKEGINCLRPHMKFGRALGDYESDDRCYRNMESVPMRNPLFNGSKVKGHSFQCLTAHLRTDEGLTTIFSTGYSTAWLLRTRDICISHIASLAAWDSTAAGAAGRDRGSVYPGRVSRIPYKLAVTRRSCKGSWACPKEYGYSHAIGAATR